MELNRKALGKQLREIRKKEGLTIENMSSKDLSSSTISKIENGHPQVGYDMIKKYCVKLGYDIKKAPTLTGEEFQTEEEKREEFNKIKLSIIENLIRANHPKLAQDHLKELELSTDDPLKAVYYFLKAKIYILKNKIDDAENCFHKAIQFIDSHPEHTLKTNIKANSYVELGSIEYKKNKFSSALNYAKKAFKAFDDSGERQYLKHVILMNQAVYLELINQNEQALNIINDLWKEIDNIKHLDVILNMYDVHATILKKSGLYQKAIQLIKTGIEIAVQNQKHGRAGELWKTLGMIYKSMNIDHLAIECLNNSKFLLNNYDKKHQLIVVNKELAEIYNHQKKWRKAQKILRKSLSTIDISKTHMVRYIQAKITLGISCYYLKEYHEAQEHFTQALQLSKKHQLKSLEYKCLLEFCKLLKEIDSNKFNQHLNNLFDLATQLDKRKE